MPYNCIKQNGVIIKSFKNLSLIQQPFIQHVIATKQYDRNLGYKEEMKKKL